MGYPPFPVEKSVESVENFPTFFNKKFQHFKSYVNTFSAPVQQQKPPCFPQKRTAQNGRFFCYLLFAFLSERF